MKKIENDIYEEKINELLLKLTLDEKIGMIHGAGLFRTASVERLGIPSLVMSDGPMGVRAEFADNEWVCIGKSDDFVSYLPCNSAVASTWNRALFYESGRVLGSEARGRGKDVILAPGINIKRSPLCGRNFEYMSEDPRLIEEIVVPFVKGVQENDVAACVKHFAANSQETARLEVNCEVDEETLNEIYFPGFKAAIEKGNLYSLMGAYNKVNGEFCSMSKFLLNQVLRNEWNYDGMIVSDWGAIHDTYDAATSALDIEMDVHYNFDNHFMANPLLEKIKSGEISEAFVDEKVKNILRLMFRLNMIGENRLNRKKGEYNSRKNQESILKVARESLILLKNDDNTLPINSNSKYLPKVAVIGQNAVTTHANGGGSSEIKALYEITPLLGIKKYLGGNAKVEYAPGYYIPGKEQNSDINWQAASTQIQVGEERDRSEVDDSIAKKYRDEAIKLALESDICIFVGGSNHEYDLEGQDRTDMVLPYKQNELITELLKVKPDTSIVIYAGSPVEMPWIKDAKAVLWSYFNGMEGGTAIAETLFGEINPSGKLAETFIKNADQNYAQILGEHGKTDEVKFKDKLMVGYRYYDTNNTEVLFPFGHGLSYSEFEYSKLYVNKKTDTDFEVEINIKNISEYDGAEVVQLYVAQNAFDKNEIPAHELKAFEKVFLKAHEEKKVVFSLNAKDFSHYKSYAKDFVLFKGKYEIEVGASSRDIRSKFNVEI